MSMFCGIDSPVGPGKLGIPGKGGKGFGVDEPLPEGNSLRGCPGMKLGKFPCSSKGSKCKGIPP